MLSIHVLWKIKQLLKCGLFAFQSPAFYLHPGWPYMFISGDIMWIKKAWLQIRLCASAVTAWPVSSMQHPSFFGTMASEGFLMWIILLPSSFECLGYVQSVLEGEEEYCFVTKRCAGVFTEDARQVTSSAAFICSGRKTCSCPPRLCGREGTLVPCHCGVVGEPTLPCGVRVGAAGAEKQLALAMLLSVVADSQWCSCPKCPGLWSLISRGCLWLSLLLGSSSYCQ